MAEIKIKITDNTSISDIAKFFKGLDDTQQVRARQTRDGAIELYVRGSSKWHLLTDNLKLGFLVTRDYQAAQEKIDDIFKKNGVIKSIKTPQEKLNTSFSNHQHDFYVREIKSDFQIAQKVLTQQEISKKNVEKYQQESLILFLPENLTSIVEYLTDGFDTTPYATLEFIKFIQLATPTIKQPNKQLSRSVELDFEQIENFAIEWQKLMVQKKSNSTDGIPDKKNQSDGFAKISMTENFINKITAGICENITFARADLSAKTINESSADIAFARLDLSAKTINESSADLVIFDPSSGYTNSSLVENNFINSSQNIADNGNDNIPSFAVTSHRNVKTFSEKSDIEGFKIVYTGLNDSVTYEETSSGLYKKLGAMIEDKIKLRPLNKSFTIHLPILNPFDKEKLTPEEEAMNLSAFVEHTNTWLSTYPNLRIQVQMPQDANTKEFEEAYQLARHKNQPTN
jgi:hypothetical protein